jgi:hypothetical protein
MLTAEKLTALYDMAVRVHRFGDAPVVLPGGGQ